MRTKMLSAAFLLAMGFCLAPAAGYGEVVLGPRNIREGMLAYSDGPLWDEVGAMATEIGLLRLRIKLNEARVNYMMRNPEVFLDVHFYYDPTGWFAEEFPVDVNTKGKIFVWVQDNKRGGYSYESGTALLDLFEADLEVLYTFIEMKGVVTDMDTDIVAQFFSSGGIPLGYFCLGEYRLWEEKQSR